MRFGAAFWIGGTWPDLRDAALAAERAGFDSLWVDDHLLADEGAWTGPKLEGWSVAAALAPLTTRVSIGHLVSANTFRAPALTAKLAITLDHLSGGRAVLGMGAGWFEREHDAYGLDFGSSMGERLERLGEAVEICRRLLDGERFDFEGRFYTLHDALAAPRPIQPHLPILIGGSGPRRTLPLVARWADQWNAYSTPKTYAAKVARLDELCAEIGRDPGSILRSLNINAVVRPRAAAAEAAWATYVATYDPQDDEERLAITGTAATVAERLRRYVALGVDEIVWVFRIPWDLETIEALPAIRTHLRDRT